VDQAMEKATHNEGVTSASAKPKPTTLGEQE